MREIKFRAWDLQYKKMYLVEGIFLYQNKDKNGMLGELDWKGLGGTKYFGEGYLEQCKLMQCTGLKDKNGKEIFEGDICFKEGYGKKCIIRWNIEWLKFEAFYGISDNGGDRTIGLGYWKEHLCHICDNCGNKTEEEEITEAIFGDTLEIIGNVYENPNLLENENKI